MYIRRYITGSVIFLAIVSWFVYAYITQDSTGEIDIYNTNYYLPDMPIAIAVLIPAALLFVLTLGHMLFYSFMEFLENRSRNSDFKKLENAIKLNLMGEPHPDIKYKSSLYRDIGELLNISKIEPLTLVEISDKNKFAKVFRIVAALKRGAVLELDNTVSYKLKEQNYWNALKKDDYIAEKILMEKGFYSDELYQKAFAALCNYATYPIIERYNRWFNLEAFINILKRINAEKDGLQFTKEEIYEFLDSIKFDVEKYLQLAKGLRDTNLDGDLRIDIFKYLYEKDETAIEGYLFVLLDLEKIEDAEQLLQNFLEKDDEEHKKISLSHIEAYLILKREKPDLLPLDYFIRIDAI